MKQLYFLFFVTSYLLAQQSSFSGKIVDEFGNPISECSIILANNSDVFYSDASGEYSFSAKYDSLSDVFFSRIGFENLRINQKEFFQRKNIVLKNKVLMSQTVLVKATLGKFGQSPMTFSEITKNTIQSNYSVQDVPEILSYLPSTTFYSEGGSGIGYNYLNIRGFDQRRISVSVNGIPQNDPEDHNVYWVDFPDILQDAELIQVQRGSGSGVIGYPSLGGSINIISSSFSNEPLFKFSSTFGSFNTQKLNLYLASGLIDKKYSVYVRLSKFKSDGYRDLNWVDFKSFYVSAVRFDEKVTTQINIYGAPIADGLTYTGLPKFAIKNKNYRKKNFSYWEADDKTFTYSLNRRKDEIENFYQPHYELLNDWQINENVKFNSALFLVVGDGFFDYDGSWADTNYFRLTKSKGFNVTQNPVNSLIRATVKNNQWGWLPKLSFKHHNGEFIFGAELRIHKSSHFGNINFAENLPAGVTKNYRYYDYSGSKTILNFFGNENYQLFKNINLLLETQFSFLKYRLYNEKFLNNDFSVKHFFVNPRIGLNFKSSDFMNYYLMYSSVAKEPRLKNYYDAAESSGGAVPQFESDINGIYDFNKPLVKPERMHSFEFGLNYIKENLSVNFNAYYMLFNDEIINQGQIDKFGQPITGNIDRSIHSGLELSVDYKPAKIFELIFNSTLSKNFISDGFYFIDKDNSINLSGNKISGFPDFLMNAILKFNYQNFILQLSNKYVGNYFSDNFDKKLKSYLIKYPDFVDYNDNRVDSYFVTNLFASYSLDSFLISNSLRLYLQINNLWNNKFATYAIGKEFFPNAELNYSFGAEIKL